MRGGDEGGGKVWGLEVEDLLDLSPLLWKFLQLCHCKETQACYMLNYLHE